MTMVSRDDHHAPGFASLAQQGQKQAQVLQRPTLIKLIWPAEMIVHGVVDHAYNLLLLVGDRCTYFRGQTPCIG